MQQDQSYKARRLAGAAAMSIITLASAAGVASAAPQQSANVSDPGVTVTASSFHKTGPFEKWQQASALIVGPVGSGDPSQASSFLKRG